MPELDRRDFLKLVGGSAGAAAAAGCSEPIQKLVPYVIQPEEVTPGLATWYASTCQECSAGCGLLVKTREGRPIKLEGNPEHPVNRGALCARAQVAHGRAYHPDRYEGPMKRGAGGALESVSWEDATTELVQKIQANPKGVYVLGGPVGPTLDGLIDRWVDAVGAGGRIVYEPFGHESLRAATETVFGRASVPIFDLSSADLVLDFGSDFLDTGLSPVENARQLAEARDLTKHPDGGAKLVSIGPRMTLTASNADVWLPAGPGSEGAVALALAKAAHDRLRAAGASVAGDQDAVAQALAGVNAADAAMRAGVDPAQLDEVVDLLLAAKAPVALPPGVAGTHRRATAATAAVLLLNAVTGAVGERVRIPASDAPAPHRAASLAEIKKTIEAMNAGQVDVLIVHDANPVYSLPADAGFVEALGKVGLVVSTASLRDETSQSAGLVLPDHAPMEAWGDSQPRAGVRSLVQPTLRPLKDTRALGDTLLDVGRGLGADVAGRLPEGSFRSVLEGAWADTDFRAAQARGGVFDAPAAAASVGVDAGLGRLEFKDPQFEGEGDYVLVAYPHSFLGDGRGAAQGWLQEIPDPVVKVAWQSWAEISPATAERLGVVHGDVIAVETGFGARRIELPVYPRAGVRDDIVAVAIGQGHTVGWYASLESDGQPGVARGVSVISVLPALPDEAGGRAWLAARARLSKTGRYQRLPQTQNSDNQRGRDIAQSVSLAALAGGGGHGEPAHGGADAHGAPGEEHAGGDHGGEHQFIPDYDPYNDAAPDSPYRWGMAVDLDRCTGCSACVAACYTENNIPVVGESEVLRYRHMAWMNIQRYVGDGELDLAPGEERRMHFDQEQLGETDVRNFPMLCQQCGAAPCEPVCPVFATYHNPEGLNAMIYNRCVGTRYCANNCSYKVRRFNYFDYSQERWPGQLYLMLNPDVTARQQGVMEKCTFCVQRIAGARQTAKDEDRAIADGEIQTACQQACPTQAITFGNLRDDASAVAKKSANEDRGYAALEHLNTRPAITYLAKVDRTSEKS